jgi:MFS family permease
MVLGSLFAIIGGWAFDKYGPRTVILLMGIIAGLSLLLTSQTNSLWQLFLTYSLLLSIGTSAIFAGVMSTVSRWFDRKRGIALGIASSGAGLGTVVIAPLAAYLISSFDWRMAFAIIGGIILLVVIPSSRLLRKDPYEIGTIPDGTKPSSIDRNLEEQEEKIDTKKLASLYLSEAMKTRSFWFVIFIWFFIASSFFLVLTHMVPHITDIGFSPLQAASVLSLMGVVAIPGRVIMGAVSDKVGRKVTTLACAAIQTIAVAWLIWAQDMWMFYLFAVIFGLAWGGMAPCAAALVGEVFGLGRLGLLLGVLDVGYGIGAAIGPVVAGLIFDISESYYVAFLFGIGALLVATILIALVKRVTNHRTS